MITQEHIEGQWHELKGRIREAWGQLTDSDLTQFKGSVEELVGMIQKRTGQTRQAVEAKLETLSRQATGVASQAGSAIKEAATVAAQQFNQGYEYASDSVSEGYHQAEAVVQKRPVESVVGAFGFGLLAGLIIGLTNRSR